MASSPTIYTLTRAQKIRLFRSMVLSKNALEVISSLGLTTDHFDYYGDAHEPYSMLMTVVSTYYEDYPREERVGNIRGVFFDYMIQHMDRLGLSMGDVRELKSFLNKYCVKADGKPVPRPLSNAKLREYTQQYITRAELQKITSYPLGKDVTVEQISELREQLEDVSDRSKQVTHIDSGVSDSLAMTSLQEISQRAAVEGCGITWVDKFMDGGVSARECYGFVGPPGSCKTTFASMIASEIAQKESRIAKKQGRPPRIVYYFSWEETRLEAAARLFSYLGNIRRSSFVSRPVERNGKIILPDLTQKMSTSKRRNYKSYELESMASYTDGDFPGELERYERVQKRIGDTLKFIDMTDPYNRWYVHGADGVEGIASVIRQSQRELKNPGVACVLVDYVNRAVKRFMSEKGINMDQIRHYSGSFPGNFKDSILSTYDCHGWLVQQASTSAIDKNAGVVPSQGDASEARNFTENLAFGFAVGTKSTTGHCVFAATKQRRNATSPPIVVKIHSLYNRVDRDENIRIMKGKLVDVNTVMEGMDTPAGNAAVHVAADTHNPRRNLGTDQTEYDYT